jgi:hypothetical protein
VPDVADAVIERIHRQAVEGNDASPSEVVELARYARAPRWRLTPKFLEFECGCSALRCRTLNGALPSDPIIFRGLPEQAVYFRSCRAHEAGLNDYVHFQGFVDFAQWRTSRWTQLTGEQIYV